MSEWKTDGRVRPVFVEVNGEKQVALSNGYGQLFQKDNLKDDLREYAECKTVDSDMYEITDYKYLRGVSGHDF